MAPPWLVDMLGWRESTGESREKVIKTLGSPLAPNLADVGGPNSLRIANHCYGQLGVPRDRLAAQLRSETQTGDETKKTSDGIALERAIAKDIDYALKAWDRRPWVVKQTGATVSDYVQFSHLAKLDELLRNEMVLRGTMQSDYQVNSDVLVGVSRGTDRLPFLHASISSKWTIRSDRVQNVRQEFTTLVRNRKGRLPHLILVTAEPLPSRVISIARGTGELDAVYHLLFAEVDRALTDLYDENPKMRDQAEQWKEMCDTRRLLSYADLAETLSLS